MASLSSIGIGSGLDANNIVSQLVALEKQPLRSLQVKAATVQSQMSAYGQIQSQVSALTDAVSHMAITSTWSGRTATSSNTSAATVSANSFVTPTSFSLDVDALAQQQSVSSAAVTPGTMPGAGTLTLQLGTWSAAGASFAAGTAAPVNVTVGATDTLSSIATSINVANMGVVASVFNDGTKERLVLQSKNTGAAAGFRVQSPDPALAGLVFDPQTSLTGMADPAIPVQYGQDAKARINGLAVTSPTNTLTGNIPGVTIKLVATTTTNYGSIVPPLEVKSPVTMSVSNDVSPGITNVQNFVSAYNALNQTLSDLTKYDAATKTGSLFQGDSSVVGLQRILRNLVGSASSGSSYQRLADVGVTRQIDGSLAINSATLNTAANNADNLQKLFTSSNSNSQTNGLALRLKTFGEGLLASGGGVSVKAAALQAALASNAKAQDKVNAHASLVETRLKAQYSALDAQMGKLNALNAYVSQQVTQWNKP